MDMDIDVFRKLFFKRLTVDSVTNDRRRRDYNQAIFDAKKGSACFSGTDLDMVMDKFELAVSDYKRREN